MPSRPTKKRTDERLRSIDDDESNPFRNCTGSTNRSFVLSLLISASNKRGSGIILLLLSLRLEFLPLFSNHPFSFSLFVLAFSRIDIICACRLYCY